jgi:hypothetical protein
MPNIYFNLKDYIDEESSFYEKLYQVPDTEKEEVIKDLYSFYRKNYLDGIIGPRKFAYDIAGIITTEFSKSKELEQIISLAGELELPDHHISGDLKQTFQELLILVERYCGIEVESTMV